MDVAWKWISSAFKVVEGTRDQCETDGHFLELWVNTHRNKELSVVKEIAHNKLTENNR